MTTETDVSLAEIVDIFRDEARELLDRLGDSLLELEHATAGEEQRSLTLTAYRSAHNIKGSALSLGLGRVGTLIHALEELLVPLRDGTHPPTPELVDRLLVVLDALRPVVAGAQPGEEELQPADEEILELLQQAQAALGALPDEDDASSPVAEAPREDASRAAPEPPPDAASSGTTPTAVVRISQARLSELLAQLEELVETRLRMEDFLGQLQRLEDSVGSATEADRPRLGRTLRQLGRSMELDVRQFGRLLGHLQDNLTQLVAVPLKTVFPALRRAVRDAVRQRHVAAELHLSGGDWEMDRRVVETLTAPLVHLLRNAVAHGIESPEERQRLGKPPTGRVTLVAHHQRDRVRVDLSDDGRGIDFRRFHEEAVARGLAASTEGPVAHEELVRLLFSAGLSTAGRADSLSGRGVGIIAVKRAIDSLRGHISVRSEPGRGTTFSLSVPLALAGDRGLFVWAGGTHLVIPRLAMTRVLARRTEELTRLEGMLCVWFQERQIPVVELGPTLAPTRFRPRDPDGSHTIVMVTSGDSQVALAVDDIEGEADIVVRDVGSFLSRVPFVSGLTVTSSGEMCFVLDAADLVRAVVTPGELPVAPGPRRATAHEPARERVILVVDDSVSSRILNSRILAASGFRILTAANGEQALGVLEQEHCDLVLSDIQMPVVDGFELTRRIKADPRLAQLPVILLTALGSEVDRARGVEAGADAYLVKSAMTQQELVQTIDDLV